MKKMKMRMIHLKLFSKDEILSTIVENTNLYRVQKSGTLVNTTEDEISSFIGIHILMGIVQLPNYEAYWSRELQFPPVADVMPINRYEKLRQFYILLTTMLQTMIMINCLK